MGVVLLAKNSGNCGNMYKPTHRKGKTNFKFKQQIWYNFMDVVNETEILAFIGLLYLCGLAGCVITM